MRKWLPLALVAADFAFAAAVYPHLPARVPSHWNLHGQVDAYSGRTSAALVLPALALAVWLLLRALPRIDPRRVNYAKFAGSYDAVVAAVVAMIVVIHLVVLGAGLGWPVPMDRVMPIALGALFVVIGNVLPRARSNWWFGIRTPWTLSNERVWERTHRVGGYLMFAAGLLCIAAGLLPGGGGLLVVVAAVLVASLGSTVYSYFAWKQETSR